MRRSIGRIVSVVTLVVAALAAAVTTGAAPVPAAGAQTPGPTGEFTPVTPARILDTRSGLGQPAAGAVGPDSTIDVQVTGRGGVPATGVSSVVLNVTAVTPTAGGFLTVFPAGTGRPTISNVNFSAGQVVPNMVTVALGDGGRLSVYNPLGSTHVLFDVVGFYADGAGPAGSRFTAISPWRRMDTRNNWGFIQHGPMTPGQTLSMPVTDQGGVPSTGVTAVVMNVTVTEPTAGGYVRVTPQGGSSTTSSLNFVPGQTVPNLVTVPVPASGRVDFFNPLGYTHVIADVVGYYGPAVGEAGRFVPIQPVRYLDSRLVAAPLAPDTYGILNLGWAGGVSPYGVDAAVLNVTATEPTAGGFLTVFDDDLCTIPGASNLNFTPGQTVANQVITGLSSSPVPPPDSCAIPAAWPAADFYNPAGWTHVIVDVFGYFTNSTGVAVAMDAGARRSGPAEAASDAGTMLIEPASERLPGG